jgi:hypothetical protein
MTFPREDFQFNGRRYYAIQSDMAYDWFKGAVSPRSGETGPLYRLQIGAFGHANFIVFAAKHEGLEHAIEEVGAWLADNAPGELSGQDEMNELYNEAAQDLYPDEMAEAEEGDEWHDLLTEGQQNKVMEQAEADLMYTESGWLTSYEIHLDEVEVGTPLFGAAFSYAMEDYEDGISDNIEYMVEIIEEDEISPSGVMKILKSLGVNYEDRAQIWNVLIESGYFTEDYQYFSMTDYDMGGPAFTEKKG